MRRCSLPEVSFNVIPRELDFDCPPKMDRFLRELREAIVANRITSFVGGFIDDSLPSGTALEVRGGLGSGLERKPFSIVDASTRTTAGMIITARVRVTTSALAADIPTGFSAGDDPPFILGTDEEPILNGDIIFARVECDKTSPTLDVISRTIGVAHAGDGLPEDETGNAIFYMRIGSVLVVGNKLTPVNDRFGPIPFLAFRRWFSSPAEFSPKWD